MNAALYARVSTDEQATEGHSIDAILEQLDGVFGPEEQEQ